MTPTPNFHSAYHSPLLRRQLRPEQVTQATQPVQLWFNYTPTAYDVVQRKSTALSLYAILPVRIVLIQVVKVADCWLAASSLAVVQASEDWMSHLFYLPNGTSLSGQYQPTISEVRVLLWDPVTRKDQFFPASVFNQSKTEDRPGERWWNSAIMQAMIQLGGVTRIGGIFGNNATIDESGGDAAAALSALTGYPSLFKKYNDYGGDTSMLYSDLEKAYAYKTPIVISTKVNTTVGNTFPNSSLHGSHAYAVQWTRDFGNGNRTVVLKNPWGFSMQASLDDIMENMNRVVYLDNFRELNWQKATGAGDRQNGTVSLSGAVTPTASVNLQRRRKVDWRS